MRQKLSRQIWECRTCQRMEASDPEVVPDIGASQTGRSNTLSAIPQKLTLRPIQGLCAAVGEIPPSYRKWLKIAISSSARASERLSKLRNIRYRELAIARFFHIAHFGSNHRLSHGIPPRSSVPLNPKYFCQSRAHLHSGKIGKDFQARHPSIKLQARSVNFRARALSCRC